MQGKTDMISKYGSLPAIRSRMHGEADTLHLLKTREKEISLARARDHLDVTRKNFLPRKKTPPKYGAIEDSITGDLNEVNLKFLNVNNTFVMTRKSEKGPFTEEPKEVKEKSEA